MVRAADGDAIAERRLVTDSDLLLEFMMNALRLRQGVSFSLMQERTGLSEQDLGDVWRKLADQGLVRSDRVAATELGYRFLNRVLTEFLD